MAAHAFEKACCKRFEKLAVHFLDESTAIEAPLAMLAGLCEAASDPTKIEPELVEEIGSAIQRYLDQRRVLEHHFFDRDLAHWQEDNPAVAGEIACLRLRSKESA